MAKYKVILPDEPIPGVSGRLVSITVEDVQNVGEAMYVAEEIMPVLRGYLDSKLVVEVEG